MEGRVNTVRNIYHSICAHFLLPDIETATVKLLMVNEFSVTDRESQAIPTAISE